MAYDDLRRELQAIDTPKYAGAIARVIDPSNIDPSDLLGDAEIDKFVEVYPALGLGVRAVLDMYQREHGASDPQLRIGILHGATIALRALVDMAEVEGLKEATGEL